MIAIKAMNFKLEFVILKAEDGRPSANTENSRRTREKPLVPRVGVSLQIWVKRFSWYLIYETFLCPEPWRGFLHIYLFHFLADSGL